MQLRIKIHHVRSADFIVGGWVPGRGHLTGLLQAAATDTCPFTKIPPVPGARWVLPRLVGEVRNTTRLTQVRQEEKVWRTPTPRG
ncbi:hypothetical protein ACVWXU_000487 [Streptomyces sp. TE33382]